MVHRAYDDRLSFLAIVGAVADIALVNIFLELKPDAASSHEQYKQRTENKCQLSSILTQKIDLRKFQASNLKMNQIVFNFELVSYLIYLIGWQTSYRFNFTQDFSSQQSQKFIIFNHKNLMNQKGKFKVPDFSNPYSPHNKSVMSIISTKRRRSSLSPSINPRTSISPISSHLASISHVPQIQKYHKNTKLALGKQRLDKIKDSLEIQQQSKKKMIERIKRKNFYFKYQQSINTSASAKNDRNKQTIDVSNRAILKAAEDLRKRDIVEELTQRATKRQSYTQNTEKGLSHIKKSLERSTNVVPISMEQNFSGLDVSSMLANIVQPSLDKELDRIVSIKQDSFFQKQLMSKDLNIFHLLKQPNHPSLKSGWEQLRQLCFNFELPSHFNNKRLNQDIFNSLSTFTRIAAKDKFQKFIKKDFKVSVQNKNLEQEGLTLQNMFTISNGLLTPDQIIKNKIKDKHQDLSDNHLKNITSAIVNKSHANSKSTNKHEDKFTDKTEAQYFRQIPLTDKERKNKLLSQVCLQKIRQIIGYQAKCKRNTIHEKYVHEQFEREKAEILIGQIESIPIAGRPDCKNVEKKVRLSKLSKDKCENIKIQDTVRIFQEKKRLEHQFKPSDQRAKRKV